MSKLVGPSGVTELRAHGGRERSKSHASPEKFVNVKLLKRNIQHF